MRHLLRAAVVAAFTMASLPALSFGPSTNRSVEEKNPAVARANAKAVALSDKGDKAGAIAVLDEAARKYPEAGLIFANRGAIYYQLEKYDEAIKDYTQAIGLGSNDAVTVLNRSTAYFARGDYDLALDDCKAIIRTSPRNAVAYRTCGAAYAALGERAQAFEHFDESIRLAPRAGKTFMARARAYEQLGQPDLSLADLDQAARLQQELSTTKIFTDIRERAKATLAAAAAKPAETSATAGTVREAPGGENRVALVIGNGSYAAVPSLPNPPADADAMAQALRASGFRTVTLRDNLGAAAMRQALNAFSEEAAKADWALVYYAGHGIEVNGQNYLIPVDAKLATDRSVQFEALSLETVLASTEGARKLRVVILDACRDNPFLRSLQRTVATRAVGRGLGRIELDTGATLVAYSAKAGQLALDGAGSDRNSPFARALIRNMTKPGVDIRKFFGLVRDDVMASTGNAQEPFVYGSLGGDDYFLTSPK